MADDTGVVLYTLNEPDPNVVQLLRDALARAEAGETVGVAVAEVSRDNGVCSVFEKGHGSLAELGFATQLLNSRIVGNFLD